MKSCEVKGKELLDWNVITQADLSNWLNSKNRNDETIISLGLPSYTFVHNLVHTIIDLSRYCMIHSRRPPPCQPAVLGRTTAGFAIVAIGPCFPTRHDQHGALFL